MQKYKKTVMMLVVAVALTVNAISYRVVYHYNGDSYGIPTDSITEISFVEEEPVINLKSGRVLHFAQMDYASFSKSPEADTLKLYFAGDVVVVDNPRADEVDVTTIGADVNIGISPNVNIAIEATGYTSDGSVIVNSESSYSLLLNGVYVTSKSGPAFYSVTNARLNIELKDDTDNRFADAEQYTKEFDGNTPNGCFTSMGHMDVFGNGNLRVSGHRKHAIYCKKGIRFKEGSINVDSAPSDAIHSGKYISVEGSKLVLDGMQQDGFDMDENFTMESGSVEMVLTGDGAKGIKSGDSIVVYDGYLSAVTNGNLVMEDGELTYCSLIKSNTDVSIYGGEIALFNNSDGGKGLTCKGDFTMSGGTLYAEANGTGAGYVNGDGEQDYYTDKCIDVSGDMLAVGGEITCIATGLGGKGITVSGNCTLGMSGVEEGFARPVINIETRGTSIVNNVEDDIREGCPKGFKVSQEFVVYDCDMHVKTHGMGGEGVECLDGMYVYGGSIESDAFDDGINISKNMEVYGGSIYCYSADNDGIDSNGRMTIAGGTVTSMSGHNKNEAFDTEDSAFIVSGGNIFGIGPSHFDVGSADQPFYLSKVMGKETEPEKVALSGLSSTTGKYYYVTDGTDVLMALQSKVTTYHAFFMVSMPCFSTDATYYIYEADAPVECETSMFDGKFYQSCKLPEDTLLVTSFQPIKIKSI